MLLSPRTDRFAATLAAHELSPLTRRDTRTLQVNMGKLCNQACRHCHVDAGPNRTELMSGDTVQRILTVLAASPGVSLVDITGGAPELNPRFRALVDGVRALGREVMVRCNLTVLYQPGQDDLPDFYASRGVQLVASLPCYTAENVDKQRGGGVFDDSVRALQALNAVGYGAAEGGSHGSGSQASGSHGSGSHGSGSRTDGPQAIGSGTNGAAKGARAGASLRLDLVYNPLGPSLPPPQEALEADYRVRLAEDFGIRFDRLLAIANMPIHRFADDLDRSGKLADYEDLLVSAFNPIAAGDVMCRDLLSVDWDGTLSDCDFNQMLGLPLGAGARSIHDVDQLGELADAPITTATHCLGCTAGQGSSCGGALAADAG